MAANLLSQKVWRVKICFEMYYHRKGSENDPTTVLCKTDYYGCSACNLTSCFTGRSCTSHAIQAKFLRANALGTVSDSDIK